MRLNSCDIDRYLTIVKLFNKLKRKKVFKLFNDDNLFIIKDCDHYKVLYFAKDDIGEIGDSILLFTNIDEVNDLHDLFSYEHTNEELFANYNLKAVTSVKDIHLAKHEKRYLKNKNLLKDKNVMLRCYNKGFAPYIFTNKEADEVIDLLNYVLFLMDNKLEEMLDGFKNDLSCYFYVDLKVALYSFNMIEVPYLEYNEEVIKANDLEISEFKNITHNNSTAYLLYSHVIQNVKIKSCNIHIHPLIVSYVFDNMMKNVDLVVSLPNDYRNYMISILKESFKKTGIPKEIITNDRKMYVALYDLLDNVGVDLKYQAYIDNYSKEIEYFRYSIGLLLDVAVYNGVVSEEDVLSLASIVKDKFSDMPMNEIETFFEDMKDEEYLDLNDIAEFGFLDDLNDDFDEDKFNLNEDVIKFFLHMLDTFKENGDIDNYNKLKSELKERGMDLFDDNNNVS